MIKLSITGKVTANPRCRMKKVGTGAISICTFPVAAKERGGMTTWFRVTCTGRLADMCMTELQRGDDVAASGTVSARPYLDGAGKPGASLELQADEVEIWGQAENKREGTENEKPD